MLTTFSRLSVYTAAVVIFISWLISNTFVKAMQEATQNLDAVQEERTQVRQFSSLSDSQLDLLEQMAKIENSLDKLNIASARTGAEEQGNEDEADAEQDWVDSFKANTVQLAESAKELEELAKRVPPSADLDRSIKNSVRDTEAFNANVQREADAYKQGLKTARSTESGQDEDDAEGRNKHDEQMSRAYKQITKMENDYKTLDKEVVSLYDKMEGHVEKEHERSARSEDTASFIAYIFYALGTVIGGLGQWLSNKNLGQPPAAT